MGVKVTFNKQAVKARIRTAKNIGVIEISNELLKDANNYARQDSGLMISASLKGSNLPMPSKQNWTEEDNKIFAAAKGSDIKKGTLIWDTPYAKSMYYTGTPVKDRNPNASTLWAEKAKKKHNQKYIRMFQRIIKEKV